MAGLLDRLTEPYRSSLESTYDSFESAFPNALFAELCLSIIIGTVYYWLLGALYVALDLTQWPAFLYQYKIQKTSQITPSNLSKLCRQILFNQVLQTILGFFFISGKHTYFPLNTTVPTLSRFIYEFLAFNLIREIVFYYSHRWLHHPSVYKYVHKRHHEWQTPIALTAMYAHPAEHFLSNILPVALGPLLMGSHSVPTYLWMAYVITETISAHSGYQFPLNPISPVFHDFHHLKFNTNYGIFGLLDWLHGTDRIFRQSPYFKLHKAYFSFTPPEDLRYDADKMK